MGIIAAISAIYIFFKKVHKSNRATQIRLLLGLSIIIVFSIVLNWYLNYAMQWEYGIPGADLRNYYNAAEALSKGTSIAELSELNQVFEFRIGNLGYLSYVIYVFVVAFSPVVISTRFSLQLVYIIQAIAATFACNNIASFFSNDEKMIGKLYWLLLLNAGVLQQSSLLMRDIWIVFFISMLLKECKEEKPSIWLCAIFAACAAILRFYSLVITIPIFIAYGLKKKKTGVISCIAILGIFFFGTVIIDAFAEKFNVLWQYKYKFSVQNMVAFVFYPNPVTQARAVLSGAEFGYHAISGGNCAWVYFTLSYWNMMILPIVFYGVGNGLLGKNSSLIYPVFGDNNHIEERKDLFIWLLIAINIILTYSVFYDSVSEPRHKLMLLYTACFLYMKGIEKVPAIFRILITFAVAIVSILIFMIA